MSARTATEAIETEVSYAGARKGPFEKEYPPATLAGAVRTDAMDHFELKDSADPNGQQVTYKLMHGGDTIDLGKTLGDLAKDEDELKLRLVRQVSAG